MVGLGRGTDDDGGGKGSGAGTSGSDGIRTKGRGNGRGGGGRRDNGGAGRGGRASHSQDSLFGDCLGRGKYLSVCNSLCGTDSSSFCFPNSTTVIPIGYQRNTKDGQHQGQNEHNHDCNAIHLDNDA